MVNNGDFLVRDSRSHQGDFVLNAHWEQKSLHFLIRKTVVKSSETYTRVQYSLEDEVFDSVPALVHFYVGSKAALTQWSTAQIHRPVNRTLPLSYLETAFGIAVKPPSCRGEETMYPRRSDIVQCFDCVFRTKRVNVSYLSYCRDFPQRERESTEVGIPLGINDPSMSVSIQSLLSTPQGGRLT